MKYEITKYQIEKLADEDSIVKDCLKEWFPDVFKTELTIGKWYKYKLALFYVTNKISNNTNYYNVFGFDVDGNWMTDNATTYFDEKYIEANPEEVSAVLKKEAKNRGYKEGVRIYDVYLKEKTRVSSDKLDYEMCGHNPDNYGMCLRDSAGAIIFANGKWAQILPQGKTIVSMKKALKIIAKKMKVSPEDIEIKN